MIGFMRHRLAGASLLLGFVIALALTGFIHHVPTTDEAARAAFALASGDLDDVCGDPDAPGQTGHPDCPACHIVGTATVPPVSISLRDADLILVARVIAPRESRAARTVLDPARGMRAPPLT